MANPLSQEAFAMSMHSRRGVKGEATSLSYDEEIKSKKATKSLSVWNGWLLTFCVIFAVALVASPRLLKESMYSSSATEESRSSSEKHVEALTTIPECESSPWKPDEDLVGTCPGIRVKDKAITNAVDCAVACCASSDCIVWQFRADKGCLQGGDVRIGQEKDGPAAYCSDHPPFRWQGQFVKDRKDTECSNDTWHPDEQPGQCFGLGDTRKGITTAEDCMKACCALETCGAWQFQESLGCFYNTKMFSCQKSDDPIVFEPHVGRRKQLSSRTYTGARGKAAVNWKRDDK